MLWVLALVVFVDSGLILIVFLLRWLPLAFQILTFGLMVVMLLMSCLGWVWEGVEFTLSDPGLVGLVAGGGILSC